ncbi:hypothetical protein B0H14DRAFT_2563340 [Mycena olivaceomarginata]|nr:hypothetical protein B0H14DRAFT_2563340 [Mycena olivaceomarginata]
MAISVGKAGGKSWLGRITVCIFALRDAMKTVHATFKIPDYGTKHTVPDMQNEILHVAEALQKDRIQELWSDGPWSSPASTKCSFPSKLHFGKRDCPENKF